MEPPRRPSVLGRALIALALMIGFYALALGVAGALLLLIYADVHSKRTHPKLLLGCGIGAAAILWSILPRFDRFRPPGPRLSRDRQPRLFGEVEKIAAAVGQRMPAEVYLVGDVNAWVAQRGGILGIGSRRVMGIGLPLLQADNLSQFRATLAHEFGHYHGGDTSLGPLVYRTREAVVRTARTLEESESLLALPFVGYAKLFLRITLAVSRAQELSADDLACRIVGGRANATGLCAEYAAGLAFGAFLETELVPALGAGFRPPFVEGLARFMKAKGVSSALEDVLKEEMAQSEKDPYDTHPPLRERVALAQAFPPGDMREDEPRAVTLLDDLPRLEAELLETIFESGEVRRLAPVAWEDLVDKAFLPSWKEGLAQHRRVIQGVTAASLAGVASTRLSEIGRRVAPEGTDDGDLKGAAVSFLGGALAVGLRRQGWRIESEPGEPIRARKDGTTIEPFDVVAMLSRGELAADAWRKQCESLGIAALELAPPS